MLLQNLQVENGNYSKISDNCNYKTSLLKSYFSVPSMVQGLRYVQNDDQSVTVYWAEPTVRGSTVVSYAIGIKKRPLKFLNVTHYTIRQEDSTMFYNVTVSFSSFCSDNLCKPVLLNYFL